MNAPVTRPVAISYLLLAVGLLLTGSLHFGTLLLTVFFAYFALSALLFRGNRPLSILLFLILLAIIFTGFGIVLNRAVKELPALVATRIPMLVDFADRHHIDLPFDDAASFRETAVQNVREALGSIGQFLKIATKEFVMLLVGIVIAISIFLHREPTPPRNPLAHLYNYYYEAITARFSAFYQSFHDVMGAQILISAINTIATTIFVLATDLPYPALVIPATFLCGLLPIVGNILSNTLIVGIAFGISPKMAAWSLGFLVLIHKAEYFLNSKIIGNRIRHPMWLTLIAIILGETLLGIPGIILAPVILHFLKTEGSRYSAPLIPASTDFSAVPSEHPTNA